MKPKKFQTSLFIFRRDLRLDDNTGLINVLQDSNKVIPIFIFDPEQTSSKNKFKSNHALQFMLDSIFDLDQQLAKKNSRLFIFYGNPKIVVEELIKKEKIEAIFVNKDYTPFSKTRDSKIQKTCQKLNVEFKSFHDSLLITPDKILKKDKKPYSIFTPFFKKAQLETVLRPQKNNFTNFNTKNINKKISCLSSFEAVVKKLLAHKNPNVITGGRQVALKILKKIELFQNYKLEHNLPGLDATTKLSAHNKFGTVSIREVYHAISNNLGKNHPLIRQLFWRDFFTHIAWHFPHVFGNPFYKKYLNLKWQDNKFYFKAWCQGKTGFPIVDAGMRELNATGFMQNRVRMIAASFLVKDLHLDWKIGEKYFATKLVDYDPSVNNGNWQWCASTGCDAQPYFRIFNPCIQQKKFDPECIYIKKWIPELKNLTAKEIHSLANHKNTKTGYRNPIINHKQESKLAILKFRNIKKR